MHQQRWSISIWAAAVAALSIGCQRPAHASENTAQQSPRFDVLEYRVLSNSVLEARAIERAVYPFLGPHKSLEDVQAARAALESAYHNAGYSTVYVDVPEQDVNQGIVRLKVTEGRLDRVRVTGARYFSNGQIRSEMPSVQHGVVPRFTDVQSELAHVNQLSADRRITPVLRAGPTPGTVDLELKVADDLPLHGTVSVDDRYTADTSRTRAGVSLSYANLWQKFHSFSFQYQTAPEQTSEARVLAGTYVMPLSRPGQALAAYVVDTNSDVATIGTLSVLGKGRIYGLRMIEPLPASGGYYHGFSFGADFKDFSENVLLSADTGQSTPISYTSWSFAYNGTARTARASTTFNLSANFGIRGLSNSADEFENKRFRGRPNFFYLRTSATHEHKLFGPLSLAARLAGQYAVEPLVSNEQFAIGGADSVRGYLEAAELGDYGVSGSMELRTGLTPPWLREHGGKLYGLLFLDGGVVATLDPLPEQPSRADLSSWGAGLHFSGFHGVSADLAWAYALVASSRTAVGDSRIHFSLQYGF